MGQAKIRGSRQQRVAEAKAMLESMKPSKLICNNCQSEITEISSLDTRGMNGINAAFAGICDACSQTTCAFDGEPDAVADASVLFEEAIGEEGKLGFVTK